MIIKNNNYIHARLFVDVFQNSIRHNLSLQNRFIRVQNEGTGKSSWWMINPDALSAVKTPRRRAATMDNNKSFERKRGRAKKLLQSGEVHPSSASEAGLLLADRNGHLMLEAFHHQQEYRARSNSNASSHGCGGRLSPIQMESDADGNQYAVSSSSGPWNVAPYSAAPFHDGGYAETTLSESLADIFVEDLKMSTDMCGSASRDGSSCRFPQHAPSGGMAQRMPVYQQQQQPANAGFFRQPEMCSVNGYRHPCSASPPPLHQGGHCRQQYGMEWQQQQAIGMVTYGCQNSGGHFGAPSLSKLLTEDVKPTLGGLSSYPFEQPDQQQQHPTGVMYSGTNGIVAASETNLWLPQQQRLQHYQGPQQQQQQQPPPQHPPAYPGVMMDRTMLMQVLTEKPHLLAKMRQLIEIRRQQLASEIPRCGDLGGVGQMTPDVKPVNGFDQHHSQQQQQPMSCSSTNCSPSTSCPTPSGIKTEETRDKYDGGDRRFSDVSSINCGMMDCCPPDQYGGLLQQGSRDVCVGNGVGIMGLDIRNGLKAAATNNRGNGDVCPLPQSWPSHSASTTLDLDANLFDTIESTNLMDCNVDQILKHELSFDDMLDFSFDFMKLPGCAVGVGGAGSTSDIFG